MDTLDLTIDSNTILKLLTLKDATAVFQLVDQNRQHLREWSPWVDGAKTIDDLTNFLNSSEQKFKNGNGFELGIWYKSQLAGVIGLHSVNKIHKYTSIGYWLGVNFQGLGLMTNAVKLLLEYAFNDLEMNRIVIKAAVGNEKSSSIAKD